MRATFRPLPSWPYPRHPRRPATYRVGYARSLADLEREIGLLKGHEVIIGVVASEADIRMDGMLRQRASVLYPGVEVSFEVPDRRRLVFHTDVHGDWRDNLRAIALGLSALRAVDRYGITSGAEQYAGFALLEAGPVDRGRRLVEEAGSIEAALKRHHPDHGGHQRALGDVLAYRETVRRAPT